MARPPPNQWRLSVNPKFSQDRGKKNTDKKGNRGEEAGGKRCSGFFEETGFRFGRERGVFEGNGYKRSDKVNQEGERSEIKPRLDWDKVTGGKGKGIRRTSLRP